MCVVSMVHDYGRRQPDDWWTFGRFVEFKDLVKQAEKFDKATDQPHCEDPKKVALMKRIEERMRRIEKKIEESEVDRTPLYGSSILASTYLMPDGTTVQLGDIVNRAHKDSALTVQQWNSLMDEERETLLIVALVEMRREASA